MSLSCPSNRRILSLIIRENEVQSTIMHFGLDFFRPVVDWNQSSLRGLPHLEKILKQLSAKENVILLANHQTEPDPQLISLLLAKSSSLPRRRDDHCPLAQRVVTDTLAIPF